VDVLLVTDADDQMVGVLTTQDLHRALLDALKQAPAGARAEDYAAA
jgi:hypothetical protein